MEKIGKVETRSCQTSQKYLTTCIKCGSVLVFTENDIHNLFPHRIHSSDFKYIECPDCGDRITVMVERKSFISNKKKLTLKRGTKKISINKYKQLKAKYTD